MSQNSRRMQVKISQVDAVCSETKVWSCCFCLEFCYCQTQMDDGVAKSNRTNTEMMQGSRMMQGSMFEAQQVVCCVSPASSQPKPPKLIDPRSLCQRQRIFQSEVRVCLTLTNFFHFTFSFRGSTADQDRGRSPTQIRVLLRMHCIDTFVGGLLLVQKESGRRVFVHVGPTFWETPWFCTLWEKHKPLEKRSERKQTGKKFAQFARSRLFWKSRFRQGHCFWVANGKENTSTVVPISTNCTKARSGRGR